MRKNMWLHMLLYPAHTLPTAAAPVLVALGVAVHTHTLRPGPAFAAFLAGWLIQLGGVLTDTYANLVRNPNDREHPQLVEGLRSGNLSLQDLQTTIVACYLLAALAGAFLVQVGGPMVIAIGLLSAGASWIYSAGPFPVGAQGLADPLFFVFFGPVSVVGTYFVQAAAASGPEGVPVPPLMTALLLSLPVGALTTSILVIDDIRDREFDAEKGKRTVAVRLGIRWSRIEFIGWMGVACFSPVLFWLTLGPGPWILLPLATLPLVISISRQVLTLDRFRDLVPMTPRTARLLLAYSALLGAGIALA